MESAGDLNEFTADGLERISEAPTNSDSIAIWDAAGSVSGECNPGRIRTATQARITRSNKMNKRGPCEHRPDVAIDSIHD
jgi:hypothetical protein